VNDGTRPAAPADAPAGGPAPVTVVGLGNVLMGDDGFGPCVVSRLLASHEFPAGVAVIDLGTPGLDLYPHLAGCRSLVVVDTVRAADPPGTLRLYRREDVLRHAPAARLSPHDPGLKETLMTLEFAGEGIADVLLVGVVPGEICNGTGLSEPVRAALSAAEEAVLAELARLRCPAVPRPVPARPDIWWEEP
jgi:hydrogenase maturation protease